MSGRLLLACALSLTGGCSLVLDFDDPPAPPDAMQADAIPSSACDFGEDNQTRQMAHPLTPVSGELGGICELGDHDFYSIDVVDGQVLVFEILFGQTGSRGDLDVRLYDGAGTIVGRSASTEDDERLECPGASPPCPTLAAGPYFLEVYGFEDAMINGYTLEMSLTP